MELEQCREIVAKETKLREKLEQDLLESSAELRRQVIIGHHGDQERKRLESIIDAVAIINPKQVLHLKSLQLAFQFKPRKVLPSKPPDDYIDSQSSQLVDEVEVAVPATKTTTTTTTTTINNNAENPDTTDNSVISNQESGSLVGSNHHQEEEDLASFENLSFNEIKQTPIQNINTEPSSIENREHSQEFENNRSNNNNNNNNNNHADVSVTTAAANIPASSSSSFLDIQNNNNNNKNSNNNNNIDESDYILLLRVKWLLSKFNGWEEYFKSKNGKNDDNIDNNEENNSNEEKKHEDLELDLEEKIDSTSENEVFEVVEENKSKHLKSNDTEDNINVNNLDATTTATTNTLTGNDDDNNNNNDLSTEKNEPEKFVFPTFPPTIRPPILNSTNKVENNQMDNSPLNNDLTFVNSSFLIFSFLEFIKNGK